MTNLALTKARHLLPFAAVLRAQGIPIRKLLKQAQLPVTCLDDSDAFIPAVCAGPFRELAAKTSGNPDISLEAAQYIDFEVLGDFGHALVTEPTLHATLGKFCQVVAAETSNVVIELRQQSNGDFWFSQRMLSKVESGEWHSNLYVIIWMLKIVRLADPKWSPSDIWIGSKATPERYEAIERLGSKAHFEQADTGFIIPACMLALPTAQLSTGVEYKGIRPCTNKPAGIYSESIKQVLQSYASDNWLSINQFSEVTDTSVRTIQRRLSSEQKVYSDLIQQCRAELAAPLLENTDAKIADIAARLGYRNQSNFTRAFYRWAKVSPSEFRKQRSLSS